MVRRRPLGSVAPFHYHGARLERACLLACLLAGLDLDWDLDLDLDWDLDWDLD